MLATKVFSGSIGTLTASASWQFVGPTEATNLLAGQRLSGVAVSGLGASTSTVVQSDFCYQPFAGAVTPIGNHLTHAVSARTPVSSAGSVVPGPGFVTFGACVKFTSGVLDNNDIATGWVIVTG